MAHLGPTTPPAIYTTSPCAMELADIRAALAEAEAKAHITADRAKFLAPFIIG
mgnify:CR=1 FL=1|jgi:hypothetical protein